jgi:hypothetical protein
MDPGQIIYILSRLILGAVAVFLALMLWTKTRDMAWMLVIFSVLSAYIEIIWSILEFMGFSAAHFLFIGSFSLAAVVLPILRIVFLIAAFLVMIIRHQRHE